MASSVSSAFSYGGVAGGLCDEDDEGEPSRPTGGGVCLEVDTLDLSILFEVSFDICVFSALGETSDEELPVVLGGGSSGGGVSVHVLMFLRHSVFGS